jgi:hypothetical protein
MNIPLNPNDTAERSRETYYETKGRLAVITFPESTRGLAEKSVAQTREAYERSKSALEDGTRHYDEVFRFAGSGRGGAKP